MQEQLINKLNNDINCDLSKEEIKILYSNDIFDNKELYELREKRKNEYEDLCKIYNSNLIACTPDEINENTNIYIGELTIKEKLPIYNLKYIYGRLNIVLNINMIVRKLISDNLEKVFGEIYIYHEHYMENNDFLYEKVYINNLIRNFENMNSYIKFFIINIRNGPNYWKIKEVCLKISNGIIEWNDEIATNCVLNGSDSLNFVPNNLDNYKDIVCLSLEKYSSSLKYIPKDIADERILSLIVNTNCDLEIIESYIPSNIYPKLLDCNKYYKIKKYDIDDISDEKKDLCILLNHLYYFYEMSIDVELPLNLIVYKKLMKKEYDEEVTKKIIESNPQRKYFFQYFDRYTMDSYEKEKYEPAMKEVIECIPKDKFTYDLGLLIINQNKEYIEYIPNYVPNYEKLVELSLNSNNKIKQL